MLACLKATSRTECGSEAAGDQVYKRVFQAPRETSIEKLADTRDED